MLILCRVREGTELRRHRQMVRLLAVAINLNRRLRSVSFRFRKQFGSFITSKLCFVFCSDTFANGNGFRL